MFFADSSVWIDYFNGVINWQSDLLDEKLVEDQVIIGDLILIEVLQGFKNDKDFNVAKNALSNLKFLSMGGYEIALESAKNYRFLREKGVTIRKTIDVIIGTFCVYNNFRLLHKDNDFEPMIKYLSLKSFEPNIIK